jgi:hypothetical protein
VDGRFWRTVKGRIVKQHFHNSPIPYYCVNLQKQNKSKCFLVHRLIVITWIGPFPPGCETRHGSNGSLDNSICNLSYGTRSENELDKERDGTGFHTCVRRSDGIEFDSINNAAKQSGCQATHISAVCQGKRNSAGGFSWTYIR